MPWLVKLLLTGLAAFAAALAIGPYAIGVLRRLKFGQSIRDDGPQSHLKKAGTPTMGGIIILIALLVGIAVSRCFTPEVIWVLFLTLGNGLIGFIDDLIIIVTKRSLGLKARQKFFAQIAIAVIGMLYLTANHILPAQTIPFTNIQFDFVKPWLFALYGVFIIVGFSNAVNLTDGLDGLAGGTTAVAAVFMAILAMFQGQPGLAILAAALAGACFGFVWFNGPPAKVFMGDTGALALGAALGGIAIFGKLSLFLLIIGGIFVAETLSVMIQVTSYKMVHKRVFRMAPLHHHYELGGMMEPQIMIRFWLVGMVLGIFGILGYLVK